MWKIPGNVWFFYPFSKSIPELPKIPSMHFFCVFVPHFWLWSKSRNLRKTQGHVFQPILPCPIDCPLKQAWNCDDTHPEAGGPPVSPKRGMSCLQSCCCKDYHGPPKPTFWEVSMVNNLVFRWPKPLFFMVLGAYGIYTWKTQHTMHHLLLFPGLVK